MQCYLSTKPSTSYQPPYMNDMNFVLAISRVMPICENITIDKTCTPLDIHVHVVSEVIIVYFDLAPVKFQPGNVSRGPIQRERERKKPRCV